LAVSGDAEQLAGYERLGPDAELCVPTPDHYYPLLYTVGARREGDEVTLPTEGLNGGVSMLAVKLGQAPQRRMNPCARGSSGAMSSSLRPVIQALPSTSGT